MNDRKTLLFVYVGDIETTAGALLPGLGERLISRGMVVEHLSLREGPEAVLDRIAAGAVPVVVKPGR